MVVENEVRVPGVVLASILQELSSTDGDSEGFIVGTIGDRTIHSSSDTNEDSSRQLVVYYIENFLVCGSSRSFYDDQGSISPNGLESLIAQQQQGGMIQKNREIIGWWRFRRNSPLIPSIREVSTHEKLISSHSPSFSCNARPLFVLFGEHFSTLNTIRDSEFRFLTTIQTNSSSSSSSSSSARWKFNQIDPVITNLVSSSQDEYNAFASSFTLPTPNSSSSSNNNGHKVKSAPLSQIKQAEELLDSANVEAAKLIAQILGSSVELVSSQK